MKYIEEYLKFGEMSLSSLASQFLSFLHWIVFDLFIFYCVTVKTIYATGEGNQLLLRGKDKIIYHAFFGKPRLSKYANILDTRGFPLTHLKFRRFSFMWTPRNKGIG